MQDFEGILAPRVTEFVEAHVSDLLTWDILAYFHRNRDSVLDDEDLAGRLGRHTEDVATRVQDLCAHGILQSEAGFIHFNPESGAEDELDEFVAACEEGSTRLALIALVLNRMSKSDNPE